MALTFTKTGYSPGGGVRPMQSKTFSDLAMVVGEFVFDSAYATGGEALSASDIDLEEILFIIFSPEPSAGTTNKGQVPLVEYNYDNKKVMAFGASAAVATSRMANEIAPDIDLSAFTVRFIAFGRK